MSAQNLNVSQVKGKAQTNNENVPVLSVPDSRGGKQTARRACEEPQMHHGPHKYSPAPVQLKGNPAKTILGNGGNVQQKLAQQIAEHQSPRIYYDQYLHFQ